MPWVVGIDEAGYGPNLGPLVQCAVGLRLPDDDLAGWETLKPWVRRCYEKDDGRLLIDDSKKVYAGAKGFERLERGVREGLGLPEFPGCEQLEGWVSKADAGRLVDFRPMAEVRLTESKEFNAILDETDSKAVVLSRNATDMMAAMQTRLPITYAIEFICDKQGGRNFYTPILQEAFPEGWVVADREGAAESRYRITGLNREVTVVFRPKADGDSVCVALASMVCKYLREVCMMQFNAFWAKHVPGLKPTAGYPVDAKRFYAEIQPAMAKLGIPPDAVWRKK
jgi:ribonuclease HII